MSRVINLTQTRRSGPGTSTSPGILGHGNTAIGLNSLSENDGGSGNTALGDSALLSNVTGIQNTAIGKLALSSNVGYYNTAVGHQSGISVSTGSHNVILGNDSNVDVAERSGCVIIGSNANDSGTVVKTTSDNQLLVQLGGGTYFGKSLMTDLTVNFGDPGGVPTHYIEVWLNYNGTPTLFKIPLVGSTG